MSTLMRWSSIGSYVLMAVQALVILAAAVLFALSPGAKED